MPTYYKKVDLGIVKNNIDITQLKGAKKFDYSGIHFFEILNIDYLNSLFSFKLQPTNCYFVEIYLSLSTHIDNNAISCLNYYITSQNAATNFWAASENAVPINSQRFDASLNQIVDVNNRYNIKDLTLVDSFTANDNEAYFLNIGQIHSVRGPQLYTKPRVLLQFQWGLIPIDSLIDQLGY
jgi:hypothetical protein